MSDTTIPITTETRERLYRLKGPHNSYEDFIQELLDSHQAGDSE